MRASAAESEDLGCCYFLSLVRSDSVPGVRQVSLVLWSVQLLSLVFWSVPPVGVPELPELPWLALSSPAVGSCGAR